MDRDLLITRWGSTHRGTLGVLECGDFKLWTIEQPWRENRPFESCVPVGRYRLIDHDSTKYPGTYALVGGTVSYQASKQYERYAILIHIANTMDDVSGCIGVGTNAGFINDLPGVIRSRIAMKRLSDFLGRGGHHSLTIRQAGLAF